MGVVTADGDLNSMTAVDLPLISLKHTRAHTFGNVRTVVRIEDSVIPNENATVIPNETATVIPNGVRDPATLNEAFSGDNCYITDGPALWWERDGKNIIFHARSNKETGGGFRYIRIYGRQVLPNGKLALEEEVLIGSLVAAPDHADIPVATFGHAYVRAECETATGKFALTSAAQLF